MLTLKRIEEIQGIIRVFQMELESLKTMLPEYKEVKFNEETHNIKDMLKGISEGTSPSD